MGLAIGHQPGADAHVNTYNLDTNHVVPGAHKKQTNAERMAQGLGPLPPTRRSGAKRQSPSGTPPTALNNVRTFLVHVEDAANKGDMGLLSPPGSNNDALNIANDPTHALRLALPSSGSDPSALSPVDSVFSGPSSILAAVGKGGPLGPGSPGFAMLGMGQQSPDGGLLGLHLPLLASKGSNGGSPLGDIADTGISVGTDDSPAQTNMWTIHPNGRTLLAHFTNPDGSSNPTSFVTGGTDCQHTICLTGDVALFKQTYGSDSKEVNMVAWADI